MDVTVVFFILRLGLSVCLKQRVNLHKIFQEGLEQKLGGEA